MPFPNEHALRLKSPSLFDSGTFRRTSDGTLFGGRLKVPSSIGLVWAKLKGKSAASDPPILQAIRFKKSQWTAASARSWIRNHIKAKGQFEPAQSNSAAGEASAALTAEELEQEVIVGDLALYDAAGELDYESLDEGVEYFELGSEEDEDAVAQSAAQMMQLMAEEDTETEGEAVDEDAVADSKMAEDETETETVDDVEIFATGTWNGQVYARTDLDLIADNFRNLSKWVKPPLRTGHGDQKFVTSSGLPAAGWISNIRRVGDKLIATITDIPRRLAEIIRKKGYKRVSVEIYGNYQDPNGKRHGLALAALALLGGDIPAVKTLKDWEMLYTDSLALYDENEGQNEDDIRRLVYMAAEAEKDKDSTEEPKEDETTKTEEDKTEEEEEDKTTETPPKEEDKTTTEPPKDDTPPNVPAEYAERMSELERKLGVSTGIVDALNEQMAEANDKAARVEDEAFLSTHIESGKFPPALKDKALSLLAGLRKHEKDVLSYTQGEGAEAVKVDTDPYALCKDLIAGLPTRVEMAEQAKSEKADGPKVDKDTEQRAEYKDRDDHPVHGVELVDAVDKYIEANPETSYSEALSIVQKQEIAKS